MKFTESSHDNDNRIATECCEEEDESIQSELTKAEKLWLRMVQDLLNQCPSDRIGFYTIGDDDVTVYDCSRKQEIDQYEVDMGSNDEYCNCISDVGAELGSLNFPNQVLNLVG